MPLRLLWKALAYSTIFVLSGVAVGHYAGWPGSPFTNLVLLPGIELVRLFRKPGPRLPHGLLILSIISIVFYTAACYNCWRIADPVTPSTNKASTKKAKRPSVRIPARIRLLYATIGIITGNALLLMFCLSVQNGGWDFFALFAMFGTIPGWLVVGIPVALMFPARLLTTAWWTVTCLVIGAALGPLAVFLIFLVMGIANRQFSLAYTEQYFGLSIGVSTVSFAVYAVLLRRRALKRTQSDAIAGRELS